jgi:hypothetical protein
MAVAESTAMDVHENAARLIPWLLNGTLSEQEAAELQDHLAGCAACRAELDAERRLYEALKADGPLVFGGEASFEKLIARIEADEEVRNAPELAAPVVAVPAKKAFGGRPAWHASGPVRWLAAAVLIEAIGLALGPWVWRGPLSPAPYQTLSSAPLHYGAGVRVRVVFTPQLSLDQLQQLLQRIGAHVVDGPTQAQAYTLGFAEASVSPQSLRSRLAILRADAHVRLAEPIGVGADPP